MTANNNLTVFQPKSYSELLTARLNRIDTAIDRVAKVAESIKIDADTAPEQLALAAKLSGQAATLEAGVLTNLTKLESAGMRLAETYAKADVTRDTNSAKVIVAESNERREMIKKGVVAGELSAPADAPAESTDAPVEPAVNATGASN
jgi:hypothetical protein